jgi:hypothetical protein
VPYAHPVTGLHCLPRHHLQKVLKLLLVEPRVADGDVSAGLVARWDEVNLAVLHAFHSLHLDSGFGRIAFIIGRVDGKNPCLDFLEPGSGVVIGG